MSQLPMPTSWFLTSAIFIKSGSIGDDEKVIRISSKSFAFSKRNLANLIPHSSKFEM
jgi:hypothetical protein